MAVHSIVRKNLTDEKKASAKQVAPNERKSLNWMALSKSSPFSPTVAAARQEYGQKVKAKPESPKPFKLSASQTRWKLTAIAAYIEAMSATQH